jgi:hypothetical protein
MPDQPREQAHAVTGWTRNTDNRKEPTVANGFKINNAAIAKMAGEIQREFDRHPVKIPVNAEKPDTKFGGGDTYNGPVINIQGDGAQLAWNNQSVEQVNSVTKPESIAQGYEALSQAVVNILKEIRSAGLDAADTEEVEKAGRDILEEVVKEHPDQSVVKRSVVFIKGLLAPLAMRTVEGAGDAAYDWAHTAIDALGAGMIPLS